MKRTAQQLQIGDTFRRDGFAFEVKKIEKDNYRNGTPCLLVSCSMKGSDIVDSFFNFKLDTKI